MSEQRFRSIAAQLFDIVMIVDAEGVVRYVNDALTRVLGHPRRGTSAGAASRKSTRTTSGRSRRHSPTACRRRGRS